MSFSISLRVEGWKEIQRGIHDFGPALNKTIRGALPDIGLLMEASARDYCPVLTGRLRSSIGHFDASFMVMENPDLNPEDAIWVLTQRAVHVGTRVEYARIVYDRIPWLDSAMRHVIGEIHRIASAIGLQALSTAFKASIRGAAYGIAARVRGRKWG